MKVKSQFCVIRLLRGNREDLIEPVISCHDAEAVLLYPGSISVHLTILAGKSGG